MTLDVYGVGNTLVDIQVQVSDSLLESLGFAKGMMTLVDHETQQRVLAALGELALLTERQKPRQVDRAGVDLLTGNGHRSPDGAWPRTAGRRLVAPTAHFAGARPPQGVHRCSCNNEAGADS